MFTAEEFETLSLGESLGLGRINKQQSSIQHLFFWHKMDISIPFHLSPSFGKGVRLGWVGVGGEDGGRQNAQRERREECDRIIEVGDCRSRGDTESPESL